MPEFLTAADTDAFLSPNAALVADLPPVLRILDAYLATRFPLEVAEFTREEKNRGGQYFSSITTLRTRALTGEAAPLFQKVKGKTFNLIALEPTLLAQIFNSPAYHFAIEKIEATAPDANPAPFQAVHNLPEPMLLTARCYTFNDVAFKVAIALGLDTQTTYQALQTRALELLAASAETGSDGTATQVEHYLATAKTTLRTRYTLFLLDLLRTTFPTQAVSYT